MAVGRANTRAEAHSLGCAHSPGGSTTVFTSSQILTRQAQSRRYLAPRRQSHSRWGTARTMLTKSRRCGMKRGNIETNGEPRGVPYRPGVAASNHPCTACVPSPPPLSPPSPRHPHHPHHSHDSDQHQARDESRVSGARGVHVCTGAHVKTKKGRLKIDRQPTTTAIHTVTQSAPNLTSLQPTFQPTNTNLPAPPSCAARPPSSTRQLDKLANSPTTQTSSRRLGSTGGINVSPKSSFRFDNKGVCECEYECERGYDDFSSSLSPSRFSPLPLLPPAPPLLL